MKVNAKVKATAKVDVMVKAIVDVKVQMKVKAHVEVEVNVTVTVEVKIEARNMKEWLMKNDGIIFMKHVTAHLFVNHVLIKSCKVKCGFKGNG